jgi:Fe2+ or Zn2+ uptake regulation protein
LADIGNSEELARQFDDATVYRTLVFFVELEIVRQLQFQGRQTHFLLNTPGECFSFLICRSCGLITRMEHSDVIRLEECQVAELYGYASVTHELELFGICPSCQSNINPAQKPTKFLPGFRLRGRI